MHSIIKKDQVQLQAPEVLGLDQNPSTCFRDGHEPAPQRSARLIETGGVPRAIEVSCGCGESFVIDLTFEE